MNKSNKLVTKCQKGEVVQKVENAIDAFSNTWLGKALIGFGNALIAGDSGAGTAAAAATGHQYNPETNRWELTEENLKEAEGLRNNLAVLSAFSLGIPTWQLFRGAGAASTTLPQMQMYGLAMPRVYKVGKFLTDLGTSYLGGQTVDKVSEELTGNSFAENFGEMFPESIQSYATTVGDFFNPGYLLGGWATPYLEKGLTYVSKQIPALFNKAAAEYKYRQALNAYNKAVEELSNKPVGRFFTKSELLKAPKRKITLRRKQRAVPGLILPASINWVAPENYIDNFFTGFVPDESDENK